MTAAALPELVRRHLERALAADAGRPRRVRIEQTGEMRLKEGGRWLPFRAVEELAVAEVAFVWRARFRLAPLVRLDVVDRYEAGAGRLEARLFGRLRAMRSQGPDLDEGEALRYLAELPWAPHAIAANPELRWREAGPDAVEVAARGVAATLRFDGVADVVASSAVRPRPVGRESVPTAWGGSFGDYMSLGGVRVPTFAEVAWQLPEGPFTYFRGRVTALEAV